MKDHDSLACLRIMELLLKICLKIASRVEVAYRLFLSVMNQCQNVDFMSRFVLVVIMGH